MILCHCNVISKKQVDKAIEALKGGDPETLVTPGRVYKQLGCRAKCGKCARLFIREIENERANCFEPAVAHTVSLEVFVEAAE